jgi:hypothetical protein
MNFYDTRYLLWKQITTSTFTSTNASERVILHVIKQIWGQVADQTKHSIFNEEKARLKKRTTNEL